MIDGRQQMVQRMMSEMSQCEEMMFAQIRIIHDCVERIDTPVRVISAKSKFFIIFPVEPISIEFKTLVCRHHERYRDDDVRHSIRLPQRRNFLLK